MQIAPTPHENHPATSGDPAQSLVIHCRVMITDKQNVEPGRKFGTSHIRRWRDGLSLVRVMMQIGRIPAARGGSNERVSAIDITCLS